MAERRPPKGIRAADWRRMVRSAACGIADADLANNDGTPEVYADYALRAVAADLKIPIDHRRGAIDEDGAASPHPAAFQILYDAFRALDCTTALDSADRDDCASVADEAVRALMSAGLLVGNTGSSA